MIKAGKYANSIAIIGEPNVAANHPLSGINTASKLVLITCSITQLIAAIPGLSDPAKSQSPSHEKYPIEWKTKNQIIKDAAGAHSAPAPPIMNLAPTAAKAATRY